MAKTLLYDFTSEGRNACWNLNVWKTRMALNFKGIDYDTAFVDYPDVTSTLQDTGLPPNDGSSMFKYTFPAVRFPDGEHVMDSAEVIKYIESRVPEPPLYIDDPIIPRIQDHVNQTSYALVANFMASIPPLLNLRSREYFEQTRAKIFGMSLSDIEKEKSDEGPYEAARPHLDQISDTLKASGGPYLLGKKVCYADMIFVSCLEFFRRIAPDLFDRLISEYPAFERCYKACEQ